MSTTMLYLFLITCVFFVTTNQISTSVSVDVSPNVKNDKAPIEIQSTTNSYYVTTPDTAKDNRNEICPPEKSWHSADDIETMIDFIFDRQSFLEIIKANYTWHAQEIAEKHLNDTNRFEEWIVNRPEHLKHILEELANLRSIHIEPLIKLIATEIKQSPQLEKELQDRVIKTRRYLQKLENYDMVCKYNCIQELASRKKRSIEDGYYCSSIEDLYNEITSKLLVSVEQIKKLSHVLLRQIDTNNTLRVVIVQNKLQQAALGAFGPTMYQILSLQDEYHHLSQDISKMNISTDVFSIKETGLEIDTKLLIFSRAVENYGEYCRNCKNEIQPLQSYVKGKSIWTRLLNLDEYSINEDKPTIVDALIKVKYIEVWNAVQNHINTIFFSLNERLVKVEDVEGFINKLQPIKEEINNLTNQEKEVLEHLKSLAPQSSLRNIIRLLTESQQLLEEIDENIQRITAYV